MTVGRYTHAGRLFVVLDNEDASPEEKLWASVLLRAILDLCHKPSESCKERFEKYRCGGCPICAAKHNARWWILNSNGDSINSFPSVCDIVGVSPQKIRKEIKELL
ncbi:MAG: hypothetical protein ACYS1A_19365 [Planctomycetota bacterium]|jgi:hypothetical protein